jgi:hypothetical protein
VQEAGDPVFQVGGRGPAGQEIQPGQNPQVKTKIRQLISPSLFPLLYFSSPPEAAKCWIFGRCTTNKLVPVLEVHLSPKKTIKDK